MKLDLYSNASVLSTLSGELQRSQLDSTPLVSDKRSCIDHLNHLSWIKRFWSSTYFSSYGATGIAHRVALLFCFSIYLVEAKHPCHQKPEVRIREHWKTLGLFRMNPALLSFLTRCLVIKLLIQVFIVIPPPLLVEVILNFIINSLIWRALFKWHLIHSHLVIDD